MMDSESPNPFDDPAEQTGTAAGEPVQVPDTEPAELLGFLGDEPGDEESVEDYMAGLLARYGVSEDQVAKPAARDTDPLKSSPSDPKRRADGPNPDIEVKNETEEPDPEKERKPRSLPPLAKADLSAMREIANMSARGAIAKHSQGQSIGMAYKHLAIAATGMAASFGLLKLFDNSTLTMYALQLVALGIAAWSTFRFWRITSQLAEQAGLAEQARSSTPIERVGQATAAVADDSVADVAELAQYGSGELVTNLADAETADIIPAEVVTDEASAADDLPR